MSFCLKIVGKIGKIREAHPWHGNNTNITLYIIDIINIMYYFIIKVFILSIP